MKSFYDHDELMENISKKTLEQLKMILKDSTLPVNENSLKKVIEAWLIKRALFNKIIEHVNFKIVKKHKKDNKNACIAITLSGSILAIGPIINGYRKVIYTSLDMRKDVPKVVTSEKAVIGEDIEVEKVLSFAEGPIKRTSEIIDMGVADIEENPDILKISDFVLKKEFTKI